MSPCVSLIYCTFLSPILNATLSPTRLLSLCCCEKPRSFFISSLITQDFLWTDSWNEKPSYRLKNLFGPHPIQSKPVEMARGAYDHSGRYRCRYCRDRNHKSQDCSLICRYCASERHGSEDCSLDPVSVRNVRNKRKAPEREKKDRRRW